jgi:hypothetical protein
MPRKDAPAGPDGTIETHFRFGRQYFPHAPDKESRGELCNWFISCLFPGFVTVTVLPFKDKVPGRHQLRWFPST